MGFSSLISDKNGMPRMRTSSGRRVDAPETAGTLDYILDMYALPEDVAPRRVLHGPAGFAQDRRSLRGYFRHAEATVAEEVSD